MDAKLEQYRDSDPANLRCFDCKSSNAQWASLNHGTYICLMCSGIHRGLGVSISFIKSLTMDSWPEKHLNAMANGGNAKFAQVFDKYPEITQLPLNRRYKTKAAEWYRMKMRAIAEGSNFDVPMPVDGAAVMDSFAEPTSTNQPEAAPTGVVGGELLDGINTVVNQGWSWGRSAFSQLQQQLNTVPADSLLGQGLASARGIATTVHQSVDTTVTNAKQYAEEAQVNEKVTNLATNLGTSFTNTVQSVSSLASNGELGTKLSEGLTSLFGTIQQKTTTVAEQVRSDGFLATAQKETVEAVNAAKLTVNNLLSPSAETNTTNNVDETNTAQVDSTSQ